MANCTVNSVTLEGGRLNVDGLSLPCTNVRSFGLSPSEKSVVWFTCDPQKGFSTTYEIDLQTAEKVHACICAMEQFQGPLQREIFSAKRIEIALQNKSNQALLKFFFDEEESADHFEKHVVHRCQEFSKEVRGLNFNNEHIICLISKQKESEENRVERVQRLFAFLRQHYGSRSVDSALRELRDDRFYKESPAENMPYEEFIDAHRDFRIKNGRVFQEVASELRSVEPKELEEWNTNPQGQKGKMSTLLQELFLKQIRETNNLKEKNDLIVSLLRKFPNCNLAAAFTKTEEKN